MEPGGSLLRSQEPATCPYLEPDQSSPRPNNLLLEDPLNVNLPYTPRSSKRYISLRFPHQNSACTSPFPHTCCIPKPSHSSCCDHPNDPW